MPGATQWLPGATAMTAEDYRHDGGSQSGSTGRMEDDERRMGHKTNTQ